MKKNKLKKDEIVELDDRLISTPREELLGVPPESISLFSKYGNCFIIHKSARKGQTSFRITKDLLESLISTSIKIQKQPKLIITIPVGLNEYEITCTITKR